MSVNPYEPPRGEPADLRMDPAAEHRSITAWEQLPLYYNATLIGIVLLTTLLEPIHLVQPEFWFRAILGAVAANVCFSTGVILEYYLVRIGAHRRPIRLLLFGIGMLFSIVIAFAATM